MTLAELQQRYRGGPISYSECMDDDVEPHPVPTGGAIYGEEIGVAIFPLDDATYIIPYFVVNAYEGYEHFDPSRAQKLTKELAERIALAIDDMHAYERKTKEKFLAPAT